MTTKEVFSTRRSILVLFACLFCIGQLGESRTVIAADGPAAHVPLTLLRPPQIANARPVRNACDQRPGGPPPCQDTDGDGLCDSWEISGRLPGGEPLPGADPLKPDLYVQYDWMDYGPMEYPCNGDANCSVNPGLTGFSCSGPKLTEGFTGSCIRSCAQDSDCTSLGGSHVTDRCGVASGVRQCLHTHDPAVLLPDGHGGSAAFDAVAERFAEHGINLHIVRGHAQPHSHVLSLVSLDGLSEACEGGSVAGGTAGPGLYAESLYDLKFRSFDPQRNLAYHYAIFAHYSSCDSPEHCTRNCPTPLNPDGSQKVVSPPMFQQSGVSEFFGNDFIISLGNFIDEVGNSPTIFNIGGAFMHELGHNLGLHHGGGFDGDGTAEDVGVQYKPNYLSVMNYLYQLGGIPTTDAPRLDYSTQVLPTGTATQGVLYENGQLDEAAGLGSGDPRLLFYYNDATCSFRIGSTDGAVDWDGDGIAGNNSAVSADLHPNDHTGPCLPFSGNATPLRGHLDWPPNAPQPKFTYKFQCTGMGKD